MSKIFIGVAWPYANGVIHVGGVAGSYLPPDIFARYHRMRGNDVLMVSGSDMHGAPITMKSDKEGVPPSVIAERYHEINKRCLAKLGISFDIFLSTEHPTHKKVVRDIFRKLWEKKYIYEKEMLLPYCHTCGRFLPDRYVEGTCPYCGHKDARGDQCDECGKILDPDELVQPRCAICGSTPTMEKKKHLFFQLSAFEKPLKEYLKDKDYWRPNVLNFTRNWLEAGLKDRPVSRDIDWGIDIPIEGYEDKKIYVWFEAFMGYLSMAIEWSSRQNDEDKWKIFWQNPEARHYYFLGKDNIPFHTIFWPAVLMAYGGLNLPYDVPANEFMRFKGAQFSKSRGITVEIDSLLENFPPDALRYYLTVNMPEKRDSDFVWKDFISRNNTELLATYGNFAHRVLTFTHKHYGKVPPLAELQDTDWNAIERIHDAWQEVSAGLERARFKDPMRKILELATFGNQYFDSLAPWALVKADKKACGTGLHICLRIVKALCILIAPFLPFSSSKLWNMLGYKGDVHSVSWDEALEDIPANQELLAPAPLFKKLELPAEKIIPEEASLLDVRVAEVIDVKDHPNADRLFILDVDLKDEKRQLVAGLKDLYDPQYLLKKKIVVLCNLDPARLRGVVSQGMLLAAEEGENVSLLLAREDCQPGTQVLGQKGLKNMSFEDFKKLTIVVGEGREKKVHIGGGKMIDLEVPEGQKVVLLLDSKKESAFPLRACGKYISLDREVGAGSNVK